MICEVKSLSNGGWKLAAWGSLEMFLNVFPEAVPVVERGRVVWEINWQDRFRDLPKTKVRFTWDNQWQKDREMALAVRKALTLKTENEQ